MRKSILISLVIMVCFSLFLLTGCSKKEDANNNEESKKSVSESKYSWPDLEEYGISKLSEGSIYNLVNDSNKNGYNLNYKIEVKSITKDDIKKYVKSFGDDWSLSESDGTYYLIRATRSEKYSVVIEVNEKGNSAEITISSL